MIDNVFVNFVKCELFFIIELVKENYKKMIFMKFKIKLVINFNVFYLDLFLVRVYN